MAIKKLKMTYKVKNKTWTNSQIKKKNEKSHELKLIMPQTWHKNPAHMYLNS